MKHAFESVHLPRRSKKPRDTGITMVLDKNMSHAQLHGLVEVAGHCIDMIKFGWGTSLVMNQNLVTQKCALLAQNDILACPGGTLVELAWYQGKLAEVLAEAKDLGFTCIEVSNGSLPMSEDEKLAAIDVALKAGFRVVSEVGAKFAEEDSRLNVAQRVDQVRRELKAGVWKVIMEARESGTVGIFDAGGGTRVDLVQGLLHDLDPENLIFEAPMKTQQADLILRLGSDVNLGNIAPEDVVGLETLRLGLRGDTIRHFHLNVPVVTLELGAGGALAAAKRGDVIVVVDALRASSTIVTALANGIASVKLVTSAEDCVGDLTAGERGGRKIEQLDFDNSPITFNKPDYTGRELVLTSSNGAECVLAAASDPRAIVLVGCLLNAASVATHALKLARENDRNISIVMAGRNNQPAQEDLVAASEIVFELHGTAMQGEYHLVNSTNFLLDFITSDSGRNLASMGKTDDIVFCVQKDLFSTVPVFMHDRLVPAG